MAVDGNGRHKQQYRDLGLFSSLERNDSNVMDNQQRRTLGMPNLRNKNTFSVFNNAASSWFTMLICLLAALLASPANAAFLNFDNCLQASTLSDPSSLQFVPLFFEAVYDPAPGPNPLNITIYGNITGAAQGQTAPAPGSSQWDNSSETAGKIVSVVDNTYTTLFTTINLLTFTPDSGVGQFCETVVQGSCPLGPVFDVNAYEFDFFSSIKLSSSFHLTNQ
jgi:ML-like domain